MKKKFFRVNQQIRASKLRVIDNKGSQVGVLSLTEALKLSSEKGLDLVEIAPTATPPVAKITDFRRFLFEKEKKERKRAREVETKEIRVGPFISDHDLQTRLKQAKKFLAGGDNFKLTVHFTPREMRHPEFGEKVLGKVRAELEGLGQIVREPKWEGRRYTAIFAKGGKTNAKDEN